MITLKAAALQSLAAGIHTVTVHFADAGISTRLTVNSADGVHDTGDSSKLGL